MIRPLALFGLIALAPAAVGAAPLAAPASETVLLCIGDGLNHSVSIPLAPKVPGKDQGPCCAKGCHSGQSRKRIVRSND